MSGGGRLTERKSSPTEVLVVLPTFNERENLERVVAGVRHLGHDVLVVDDASPDGTGELADKLAGGDRGVRVLHRERKLGIGSAYEDAFRIGLDEGSSRRVSRSCSGWSTARCGLGSRWSRRRAASRTVAQERGKSRGDGSAGDDGG